MFCKFCGTQLEDGALYCANCGKADAPAVSQAPCAPETPPENRPLSPWAYFGLSLLFSVPVVGFIFLIVFSCSRANINRRNYARSYWCALILVAIVVAILAIVGVAGGSLFNEFARM